jgi:hypothetical protein
VPSAKGSVTISNTRGDLQANIDLMADFLLNEIAELHNELPLAQLSAPTVEEFLDAVHEIRA